MTAQKPIRSSSADDFKVFRQALLQKCMPGKEETANPSEITLDLRGTMAEQFVIGDIGNMHIAGESEAFPTGNFSYRTSFDPESEARCESASFAIESKASGAIGEVGQKILQAPAKVEPDVAGGDRRHTFSVPLVAVTSKGARGSTPSWKMEEDAMMVFPAEGEADGMAGGGGDPIPESPPSSPAFVMLPVDAATESREAQVGAHDAAGAGQKVVEPDASCEAPASTVKAEGAVTSTVVAGLPSVPNAGSNTPAALPGGGSRPPGQMRLGRGRKLCPNCNALTKSAVKQCRECKHIFSPASSRLRPAPRAHPKENEDVIPPRRRSRPSQRLMEYECDPVGPSPASAGAASHGPQVPRRPLGTSSPANGGGGANHTAASGAPGGRPAASDGAVAKKQSASGGAVKSGLDAGSVVAPQKRQKRKPSLPLGETPMKRKKNKVGVTVTQGQTDKRPMAGFSGNASQAIASAGNASVPQELLSSTVRTTVAPQLGACRVSPVLKGSEPSSTVDENWAGPGCQSREKARDQLTAQVESTSHEQRQSVAATAPSWLDNPSPSVGLPSRSGEAVEIAGASQNTDPFEGVELHLGDERPSQVAGGAEGLELRGTPCAGGAQMSTGCSSSFSQPEGEYFAGGGELMGQRTFSAEEVVDLLGDGDLLWSPLRSTSADSAGGPWQDGSSCGTSVVPPALTHRLSPPPNDFERVAALASAATAGVATTLPRGVSSATNVGAGSELGLLGESTHGLACFSLGLLDTEDVIPTRGADAVMDSLSASAAATTSTNTPNAGGDGRVWNPNALSTVGAGSYGVGIGTSSLGTGRDLASYPPASGGYPPASTVVGIGHGAFAHAVTS